MLWIKRVIKKCDKKGTLVFKTKSGIKGSRRLQTMSNKQVDSDCAEEQVMKHSKSERGNNKGDSING